MCLLARWLLDVSFLFFVSICSCLATALELCTNCFKTLGSDRLDGLRAWFLLYQIPLLECVLARWLLDAGFLSFLQPDLRLMSLMVVIWPAWCFSLGVWDCKNEPSAMQVLQKTTFAEIGFLMFPGLFFS